MFRHGGHVPLKDRPPRFLRMLLLGPRIGLSQLRASRSRFFVLLGATIFHLVVYT